MNIDDCFRDGSLRRTAPDLENARKSIQQAKMNLEDARKNISIGCHRVALIVCYTAMFHTARAILFRDGVKERSHVCIPIYLRSAYPSLAQYANILDSYRIYRHNAVYGLGTDVDETEAQEAARQTENFIGAIEKIVVER